MTEERDFEGLKKKTVGMMNEGFERNFERYMAIGRGTRTSFTAREMEWVSRAMRETNPWFSDEGLTERSGNQKANDRQIKMAVKERIQEAVVTLRFAAALRGAFKDDEWPKVFPVGVLGEILFWSCFFEEASAAAFLTSKMEDGLNAGSMLKDGGFIEHEITITTSLNREMVNEFKKIGLGAKSDKKAPKE